MSGKDDLFAGNAAVSNPVGSEPAPVPKSAPTPIADLSEARKKSQAAADNSDYSAADIEVLEGLEPVRRRPGMYIGGTDEKALHHLFAEVIDNSMDEAVAGHATWIDVSLGEVTFEKAAPQKLKVKVLKKARGIMDIRRIVVKPLK